MPKIKISKIDAARRQIETAIKLFFNNQDAVSIHTLTSAAHGILNDLARKQKVTSVYELLIKKVKPKIRKEARIQLNVAKFFFKHSDKENFMDVIEYQSELNDFWLLDCCAIYENLTGERTDMMKVFWAWINIKNKEIFNCDEDQIASIQRSGIDLDSPIKFYQDALAFVHTLT